VQLTVVATRASVRNVLQVRILTSESFVAGYPFIQAVAPVLEPTHTAAVTVMVLNKRRFSRPLWLTDFPSL
jgi:hypothetical protein